MANNYTRMDIDTSSQGNLPRPDPRTFMNAAKGASRPMSLEGGSLMGDESAKAPIKRSAEKTPSNSGTSFGAIPGPPKKLKPIRRIKPDTLSVLSEGEKPTEDALQGRPDAVKEAIEKNWVSLKDYSHKSRVQSVYNLRLKTAGGGVGGGESEIDTAKLRAIFESQKSSFKINASVGVLLRHKTTGEIRYWHSSQNNARLFDYPFLVQNAQNFETFLEKIENIDFHENVKVDKDSSEWVEQEFTNLSIYVNHLNFPIQAGAGVSRSRSGSVSVAGPKNLCFFACLAAHQNRDKVKQFTDRKITRLRLLKETKTLYYKYTNEFVDDFPGVTLEQIDKLENFFQVGVQIYAIERNNDLPTAILIRRANPNFKDKMNLDLTESGSEFHFAYIFDLAKYCATFRCAKCGQLWDRASKCARHEGTCDTMTREDFPIGHFKLSPTVFESMEKVGGISVPEKERYFEHFITYDFEAYMVDCEENFQNVHVPMSFSICSNIPGLTEPVFRADSDPDRLVSTFIDLLNAWSDRSYEMLQPRYQPYLDRLKQKSEDITKREANLKIKNKRKTNPYEDLHRDLESWLRRIPVLGFNSQKYDLNLIKLPLLKLLTVCSAEDETFTSDDTHELDSEPEEEEGFILTKAHLAKIRFTKKNNSLMCVETEKLRILDISNYLAPTSYSGYLEAFHIAEKKGYFPYEYVKSFDQLFERCLPPYEAFYSSLRGKNSLDEGGDEAEGRKRWEGLQNLWREHNMENLMAMLRWYNNLDVTCFVQAVEKQFALYREHFKIDIFKEGISLPGISLKYAMQTTDANFALYGEKFKWVYKELREAVIGGPSIIFSRYHEKDITKIRPSKYGEAAETCRAVVGVDANSLYLWSFAQDFPAGDFEIRLSPNFEKVKQPRRGYSLAAINWIESESEKRGVKILHKLNSCGEVEIGSRKLKVDGFLAEQNSIWQFHGCFYHSCEACFKDKQDEVHIYYGISHRENRERTREKTNYLKSLGYTVYEKWECEWRKEKPTPTTSKTQPMSEAQILDGVRSGSIFGLVKVDIYTPDWLKPRLAEFPPIFKNCEVGRENISPFMRAYCEKANVLKKPSRLLISSFRADRIMLITPLLKYYLDLGLQVTKVHFVVEFPDHKPCFQEFADRVCDARRQGDKDPDSDIIANTFKLTGNSAYGRICMNKAKQTDTTYANAARATVLINHRRFKTCRPMGSGVYEIESYKKKHVFDLPLQLGVFTYQYAKLRMLQWQYDFMQKYVPPRMYELSEMDTDSSYFAIAKSTLEECIPDELKLNFYTEYDQWFPALACQAHKVDFVKARLGGALWVPAECCTQFQAYDKRTPGKFKFEFVGDGIVALCSKTYICWGEKESKISCKGLQKKRNLERLTRDNYLEVLKTQQAGWGVNKGFRPQGGSVFSYNQKRLGLSYMYCKRLVHADGVSTDPLDV